MTVMANAATIDESAPSVSIDSSYLHRSSVLSAVTGITHGISRRVPGLGLADGNVGYSAPRDRDDAWRMRRQWMAASGLDADRIVVAYQMHGSSVEVVRASDAGRGADPTSRPIGQADALVTNEPGVVLMTLHADCMPILLCDPVNRAVATIHAGWRGTVTDVAGETVRVMSESFGSVPAEIIAYLGPAIGGCCYEVGEDVLDAWCTVVEGGGEEAISASGQRWRFDLAVANRWLLSRTGVRTERIEESPICTRCQGDEWFSHRGHGAGTGRYGAFIALTDN